MNGQQQILAMRRQGFKPAFVWVNDMPNPIKDEWTVFDIGPTPEQEDFRFLVGVTAIVNGMDEERVRRIAAACGKYAARVLSGCYDGRDVVWHEDTEGVLVWQK